MKEHPLRYLFRLTALVFLGAVTASGSMLVVPITGFRDRIPTIEISITDATGRPQTFVGLVDTGNGDGLGITEAGRMKLGLGLGGNQAVDGATGAGNVRTTTAPNGQAGTISGLVPLPPGQAGPPARGTLPIGATGTVIGALQANEVLIGQDFLDRFGKYEINKKRKTITFTQPDQVAAAGLFVPMQSVAHCAFETVPSNSCFSLDAQLMSPFGVLMAPFVISSGFTNSFISEEIAALLGLDPTSLPTIAFNAPLGPIDVPGANLGFGLTPLLRATSSTFGILSDSLNPNQINIIGADILDLFDAYALNTLDGRFEVNPVPESATFILLAIGLASIAGIARVRERRQMML